MSCIGQSSRELLDAQAHVWNHIFSFINSMSLKCAVQLEIPDIINNHGGSMTLSELINALPINKEKSHCISRLMRILVHSGFFLKQNIPGSNGEEDGYSLTPSSRLLLKHDVLTVRPFLLAMLDPTLVTPWHHVTEWFSNENLTPFDTAHGRTFWDYAGHEPILNCFFNDGMASDARLITNVVMKECPGAFEGLNSFVDVGGGTGTVAKSIAEAFPLMNCINFDLPHVVAGLDGSKNLTHVAGDMFVAVPLADVAFLKITDDFAKLHKQWILHNWNDAECVKILKRCKEAIPSKEKGGKVIIVDIVVDEKEMGDDESIETQLFFDMLMMTLVKGRERNEREWAKLFRDAGFSDYKITPILGLRSLIEVYP